MVNKLLILAVVVMLEVIIGLPVLAFAALVHVDVLVLFALSFTMFLVPVLIGFLEILERRAYPIRAEVSYTQGENTQGERGKLREISDRIGYIEIKGSHGENTGSKEWRLAGLNKMVQNFDYSYVYDKEIWFGRRIAPSAKVVGVMGDKGEEFYAVKYNPTTKDYKPVYDSNRGYLLWKIHEWITKRNAFDDWLRQNLFPLLQTFGNVLIILFLLLLFLKIGDIATAFSSAADKMSVCYEGMHAANATNSTVIKAGNVAGLPFGVETAPKG